MLIERSDVEVRWICDSDLSRLERFGRRYPSVQLTQEIDEILDDPSVDGVLLATPVFTHYDLARRCLEADKHTFVEKPLAPSTALAEELIALSEERGVSLMCGHTFLYSPPVRAVRELIDTGELGQLYFVSASRVNLGLHQRDVSVIWDLGPHDFSILLYWLGRPPEHDPGNRTGFDRSRHRRRGLRHDGVRIGLDRERRAQLAGAKQAQTNGGCGLEADGGV